MAHVLSAVLVIDMQATYFAEAGHSRHYPPDLISRVNERIAAAQYAPELIIYVNNQGNRSGKPYAAPFAEHLSIASEVMFVKGAPSAFTNPCLLPFLNERKIQRIEVAGIDGNCCVAATALDAARLGFQVSFPLRYIGVRTPGRFPKTLERLEAAGVQVM